MSTDAAWQADIENQLAHVRANIAETKRKLTKARCPYCGKRVTVTKTGKLWTHTDPATSNRCGRSGGLPR